MWCEEAFDLSLVAFKMEGASSQGVGAALGAGKGNWVDFHFFKKLGVCISVCACVSVYINQDFIFLISLRGKILKYHYL